MTCSNCGAVGIHACPGHPIPPWPRAKRKELARVLREYERPSSRNQLEGRYVGACQGKHVRRREPVPPMTVGNAILFPECLPWVDSSLAWVTFAERTGTVPLPHRPRYISKSALAQLIDDL